MPITPKDQELKRQRGYKDPRSFVRVDGTEVLHGVDWKRRKLELWHRCGGQCEYRYINGARCRGDCNDPHHSPQKRWPVRNDLLSNLVGLCRIHHQLLDPRKVRSDKAERGTSIQKETA